MLKPRGIAFRYRMPHAGVEPSAVCQLRGGPAARIHAGVGYRHSPIIAALLAMILVLPSLRAGRVADDRYHQLALMGQDNTGALFPSSADIFRFLDGDPNRTRALMDKGLIPWWTFEGAKIAFWRPLAALIHQFDYLFWPNSAVLMHAQSILWFGALVAAVACLYQRFMGVSWVAGVAAILYAIDDAHGVPVGFIANRNAVLAALFGVLSVLAHDRWRRDGRRIGAVTAPCFLVLSLLSAEAGIATCAYLAAHAMVVDRASLWRRAVAFIPYLLVVVVWRLEWTRLGYGVADVGYYTDPIGEPARYATSVLCNAPLLLLGQWAFPPSDVVIALGPRETSWLVAIALVVLMLLAMALTPLLRRDRTARFWALAMILSLPPLCCTMFPMDRLLLFAGIGAMGLLAQFLGLMFNRQASCPRDRTSRLLGPLFGHAFVFIHCLAAPIVLPLRAGFPLGPTRFLDQFHVQTPLNASVEQQDVVIVNAPSEWLAGFLPVLRTLDGRPVPRHTRILGPALYAVAVSRPDVRTLVICPEGGYINSRMCRGLRDENTPFALGEKVTFTGLTIEVTALTHDGRPAKATFRFSGPLEDPSLCWLQWKDGLFVPFVPPAVGETVELRQPMPALWPLRGGLRSTEMAKESGL